MTDRKPYDAPAIPADGLATYLRCPRRYEFAHVEELAADDEDTGSVGRAALLRRAICDALGSGATTAPELEAVGIERLSTLWAGYDERFHSATQRRHERRVLEATLRAYVDELGADHATALERLRSTAAVEELIGPDLTLSRTVRPSGPDDADPVPVEAPVDYVTRDGSALVGVRFVPSLAPLGLLRYRSAWADVEDAFEAHFDPATDAYDPGPVAALLETAVVLAGLRNRRDRLGLEAKTCRYVRVPLADRSLTSVNWVRETVEASVEPIDLTDRYVDHHDFGMSHEHRNGTVDDRLRSVVGDLVSGSFAPTERWDRIAANECRHCAYAVGCQDRVAAEVRFDG